MMSPGRSVPSLLSSFRATHGIGGFLTQGLAPEVARATLMRGLKFTLFPAIHQRMYGKPPAEGTVGTKLSAACATAVPEVLLIMPLEAAKVVLTTDAEKKFGNSMAKAIGHVVETRGVGGLMTGYAGVQYRQMAWGAGYFTSIGFFKRKVAAALSPVMLGPDKKPTPEHAMATDLLSGFAAGVAPSPPPSPGPRPASCRWRGRS
ncbi:hypothetical protein TeGR_g10711 [Tetraparma gracilis]|uniref:Uncharacterized protein n=1 Tax=Tetraparma gracilis TaxID=2962635 RepID=A0ABQ6MGT3_9STRA|nr:hypothetical protein TeGR_g10711 [Tetraparma gracilis]